MTTDYRIEVTPIDPTPVAHSVPVIHSEYGYFLYKDGIIKTVGGEFMSARAAWLYAYSKIIKRMQREEENKASIRVLNAVFDRVEKLIVLQYGRDLARICNLYGVISVTDEHIAEYATLDYVKVDQSIAEIFGDALAPRYILKDASKRVVLSRNINFVDRFWFVPVEDRGCIQIGYSEGENSDGYWYIELLAAGNADSETLQTFHGNQSANIRKIAEKESIKRGVLPIYVVSINDNGRSKPV